MTILPVGEWLPDLPPLNNPGILTAQNVVPLTQTSYGPVPGPVVPYTSAILNSQCYGMLSYHDPAGNAYNFAGDLNRLYLFQTGTTSYSDVSKTTGGPYNLNVNYQWSACSFGTNVIFTNFIDPVQSFLLGSSANFADLSSAAPRAKYCATIRDFLMLGYLSDGFNTFSQRVQWSAIGDPTNWPTPGTNAAAEVQSDEQDLQQTDLGVVSGIVGAGLMGADGAVFCEKGIYRVIYVGSPAVFDFQVAQGGVGTDCPRSIVSNRGIAYFLGSDRCFYAFDGASPAVPIGGQKVNLFFQGDVNQAVVNKTLGFIDPIRPLVCWAYGGQGATLYNRVLVYNWLLNRWSYIDLSGYEQEWLSKIVTLGYSLDQLDIFGTLDQLAYPLDSPFWTGGASVLAGFNSSHTLNTLGGANLAPVVDTTESQPYPGRLARVSMVRPLTDAASLASIAVAVRFQESDGVTFGSAVAVNSVGWCPQRSEGRYLRGRITLPAGTTYSYIQGIDLDRPIPRGRLR